MKTVEMRRVPSLFITSVALVAVGIFLFIGLLNRQHDLTVLSILVLVTVVSLKLWARFSKTGIAYRLAIDRNRVFPGERITFALGVENHKFLPVWLEVEAPVDGPSNAFGKLMPFTGQQSLLWYQRAAFQWNLTALRRGINEIGPLHTMSGDLFGFFQEESEGGEKMQVVVYPRIVPLQPLKLPKREFFGIPGGESPVDDPVYILGTSDYHYGRPAKYIHWKASARHQRLQEKVFDSSEQEKICLLLDMREFAKINAEEAFERGIEVLASLAVRFDRRGCAIGLLTNGVVKGSSPSIPVSRSSRQLSTVLETLARLQLECEEELRDTVERVSMIPWGTTCVCLTLQEDSGIRALVEYLKRRKTPVVILTGETVSLLRGNGPAGLEAFTPPGGQIPIEKVRRP